jgi:hypothetical protein
MVEVKTRLFPGDGAIILPLILVSNWSENIKKNEPPGPKKEKSVFHLDASDPVYISWHPGR